MARTRNLVRRWRDDGPVQPVVTVAEMREVDERALATTTQDELIERAGAALARTVLAELGQSYGSRVVVVAGKGSNGADGRVAARRLEKRGVRVRVQDPTDDIPACDLVVDAAYGTGFRGTYEAPDPGFATVVAADIPSGLQGDTGVGPDAVWADVTVTFGALKPGLLLADGPAHAGRVVVEPIDLGIRSASINLVEDGDAKPRPRPSDGHKWKTAVAVVAGSPGMHGAARYVASAAARAGAGYVLLGSPGSDAAHLPADEAVGRSLPAIAWSGAVLEGADRLQAIAIGPGLGTSDEARRGVNDVLAGTDKPVVLDADALNVVDLDALKRRTSPTVLTPHEGEFARLSGAKPSDDRIGDVRRLAARTGAVVLLKGPTTIVADPQGDVLLTTTGTPQLATAGSGDVLTGVISAFIASGVDPFHAAAFAAHVHGRAASLGHAVGMVAGDLPELVARWLSGERPAS